MFEMFRTLVTHLEGMWRFRWYGLAIVWPLCLIGWSFVYLMPEMYEARTQVYVDTESVLRPLLEGLAVRTDVTDRVGMMTSALVSGPHLTAIAEDIEPNFEIMPEQTRQALLARLEHRISVGPSDRPNIYEMQYQDQDRERALRVVGLLLNALVKDTVGVTRADSKLARHFLHGQISDYEARLKDAEERLATFKKQHVGMMPSQGQDYYSSLQDAIKALDKANATVRLAIDRRNELQKQLAGEEPSFGIVAAPVDSQASSELDGVIDKNQGELNRLRLQFTDQHPDVVALTQVIAELKARRASNAKKSSAGGVRDNQPLALNRVYQAIRIALSEAEVELSTQRAKMAQLQVKVNKLKKSVDTIPEVEAQLASLNRDYDITKAQYEALVKRLESARLSEKAEQSNDELKFRIIEPPVASLNPVGLNRPLLLSVVLVAAAMAAGGLMFLLHQIRPVFLNSRTLRQAIALPVFGVVSMQHRPTQRLRRRLELVSLMLGILLLACAYSGAIMLHESGARILQTWAPELKVQS